VTPITGGRNGKLESFNINKPFEKAGQATDRPSTYHQFPTCPFSQRAFCFGGNVRARDLEPLMIARPIVPLVGEDLNLGYLISQMIWAITSDNSKWHTFDIQDFAENIGMSEEWIISQSVSIIYSNSDYLRDQTFFRYDSTMSVIGLNPQILTDAINKMREDV
jgi:hypothetical protein